MPTAALGAKGSLLAALMVLGLAAGCTDEDAVPDDRGATNPPGGAHLIEPNDEMRRLAEQQCLDDPTLERGEIQAVDPDNTDVVLSVVRVECSEIR